MTTWQWTYNGLLFGNGTTIGVVKADGLDFPNVRTGDQPRPLVHGLWPGRDLAGDRVVTLELELTANDDTTFSTQIAALRAATTLQPSAELPLVMQLPGDVAKRLYCRPRRRAIPVDNRYMYRLAGITVQFVASDPRLYADAQGSGSAGVATAGTGLTFNATPNFSFGGAAAGGSITAVNSGDTPTPWTATVTGPITDPALILTATGQRVAMQGTVNSGETLVLDSQARTILLNGTASRYSWLQAGSQWFDLAPGSNQVQFGATSGSGTLSLAWRSAWF